MMRNETLRQIQRYQAGISDKRIITSNFSLQETQKYHKYVERQLLGKKNLYFEKDKIVGLEAMENNVVAKKSFFLNPNQNNPKIIRTNNKFYVI